MNKNSPPYPFTGHKSQLSLAGTLFNSPTALADHIRQLLWAQPLHQPFSGPDDDLLRQWVTFHFDADLKVGSGVTHFFVDQHSDYGRTSRALFIKRTDNSVVDISYKEPSRALVQLFKTGSIQRPARDAVTDFKAALRRVVDPQCLAVKKRFFDGVQHLICPVTNQPFTFNEADTDHVYPMTFDAIAWHWSCIWDIRPAEVQLVDHGTYCLLADQDLAAAFSSFHLQVANLRVISRQANNSALRYPANWSALQ